MLMGLLPTGTSGAGAGAGTGAGVGAGAGAGVGPGAGTGDGAGLVTGLVGVVGGTKSQEPGMSAIGRSQVALRTTPCPLSKLLIALQLHETNAPI